jgi:hypothetical protein
MAKKRSVFAGVPLPLLQFLVSKVGLRKAIYVGALIVAWGRTSESLGHEPTVQEYTDFWGHSVAESYRQLVDFHRVWPDDKTPQRVWEWLSVQTPWPADKDEAIATALTVEGKWE